MRVRSRVVFSLAWGGAALALGGSATSWWYAVPPIDPYQPEVPHAPAVAAPVDTTHLRIASQAISSHDLFRLNRRPSRVRFNAWDPKPASTPKKVKPTRSVPNLTLVGVAGGPPWIVLVRGIPGHGRSVVLGIGQQSGGIRLDSVRGDTARLSGFDTTWTLIPKRH